VRVEVVESPRAEPQQKRSRTDAHGAAVDVDTGLPASTAPPPPPTPSASVAELAELIEAARDGQEVRSLSEANEWFFHFVEAMKKQWGVGAASEALWRLREVLPYSSFTTSHSGIDAPGTALEILS